MLRLICILTSIFAVLLFASCVKDESEEDTKNSENQSTIDTTSKLDNSKNENLQFNFSAEADTIVFRYSIFNYAWVTTGSIAGYTYELKNDKTLTQNTYTLGDNWTEVITSSSVMLTDLDYEFIHSSLEKNDFLSIPIDIGQKGADMDNELLFVKTIDIEHSVGGMMPENQSFRNIVTDLFKLIYEYFPKD